MERRSDRRLLTNGEALRVGLSTPQGGGGGKFEPRTLEQALAVLRPQVATMVGSVRELPDALRAIEHIYIEARMLPNFLSASDFPSALLGELGAVSVGSRADTAEYVTERQARPTSTRRLILAVPDEGFEQLESVMTAGDRARANQTGGKVFQDIKKIDLIGLPDPDKVVQLAGSDNVDIHITCESIIHPKTYYDGLPVPADDDVVEKWIRFVQGRGGEVVEGDIRVVGGLTFAPLLIAPREAEQLSRFNPLRSVRPMPSINIGPTINLLGVSKVLPPKEPRPAFDLPRIAVFDGGVGPLLPDSSRSPYFSTEAVGAVDLTTAKPDPDSLRHGSGVTAAVLYGVVNPERELPQPVSPIDSFRIMPAPQDKVDLVWILDQIHERVATEKYRIVNLSLGTDEAVEDDSEPKQWTSTLDQLALDHDALFVVAAGNNGDEDDATGLNRVRVPADMVNGLTIGAVENPSSNSPSKKAWYSSVGPGRFGGRVRPTGVQFGGSGRGVDEFPLLQPDGRVQHSHGTSFATPLVTRALAELSTRLPDPTPSALRAFAVHFSERQKRKHDDAVNLLGFGRLPDSFLPKLACTPDEVHVLFVDEIRRGDPLGYQIPVPDGFTGKAEIIISLAYVSPVEPAQSIEYTRASLDLTFRPHQSRYRLNPPRDGGDGAQTKAEVVDEILDSERIEALEALGWKLGSEPIAKSMASRSGKAEIELRDAGKWETLRNLRVLVDGNDLHRPRLDLIYTARAGGQLDRRPSTVQFALLVTVRDREQGGVLYDNTVQQFVALRPVVNVPTLLPVQVRSSS